MYITKELTVQYLLAWKFDDFEIASRHCQTKQEARALGVLIDKLRPNNHDELQ